MANPVKIPANLGAASPNAGGNQGFYNPVYIFNYFEPGTPSGRANVPIGISPTTTTCIGVASAVATTGVSIVFNPQKVLGLLQSNSALTSTLAIITSAGAGPSYTATIAWQGQAAQTIHGQGNVNSAAGITDAVLSTTLSNRQFIQGDLVALTTSGTFTSAVGLAAQVMLRDDNGAY